MSNDTDNANMDFFYKYMDQQNEKNKKKMK